MSAAYVKLLRTIWTDPDFIALTGEQQRLYILLISQPDISHVGVLPLMPARWARLSADASPATVRSTLDALAVDNFVMLDEDTEELLVRTYIVHDEAWRLTNGKKSLLNAYARVLSRPLREVIEPMLLRVGATVESTVKVTVDVSQQQQQQPTPVTSNQQQQPDVAAAALDLLIEYRVATTAKSNPDGLRNALRRDLPGEHGHAIAAYIAAHPDATAADIAHRVLNVPGIGTPATPRPPDWYADPDCAACNGDGIANHAPEGAPASYGPCPCRRTEPYTQPDATVLAFPKAIAQ